MFYKAGIKKDRLHGLGAHINLKFKINMDGSTRAPPASLRYTGQADTYEVITESSCSVCTTSTVAYTASLVVLLW